MANNNVINDFNNWKKRKQATTIDNNNDVVADFNNWKKKKEQQNAVKQTSVQAYEPVKSYQTPEVDTDKTFGERLKLGGKSIVKNVLNAPVAAADTFFQVTTDPVELEIQNLERKADQGLLDDAGWARLKELKPQQYTKALDTSGKAMQNVIEAQKLHEEAVEGMDGVGAFLFDTALSIGNNLATLPANLVVPGASLALMGSQSLMDKAINVAQQGGSAGEALARGAVSGGIEAITEKVPLDNLFRIAKTTTGKKAIKEIAKQAGIEATEESVAYVANWAADKLAEDPNAEFSFKELVLSALAGGLSGGIMGGGAVGVNTLNNLQKVNKIYSSDIEAQQDLVNEGMNSEKTSKAYIQAQINQNKINTTGRLNTFDVLKQIEANQDTINYENTENNRVNIATFFEQNGETADSNVVDTLVKAFAGDPLSNKDSETIINNTLARELFEHETGIALTGSTMSQLRKQVKSFGENIVTGKSKPVSYRFNAANSAQEDSIETTPQSYSYKTNAPKTSEIPYSQERYGSRGKVAYSSADMTELRQVEFEKYYRAGVSGTAKPEFSGVLTSDEAFNAYIAGLADAKANKEKYTQKQFVVNKKSGLDMSTAQHISHNDRINIDKLGKALGVKISFADNLGNSNAQYNIKKNEIVISKTSENPYKVALSHEIIHELRVAAPKQFDAFGKAVLEYRQSTSQLDADIDSHASLYGLNEGNIEYYDMLEEVIADFVSAEVDSDALVNMLSKDKSLAEKFIDAVKKILKKLKNMTLSKEERKAIKEWDDILAKLEDAVKATEEKARQYTVEQSNSEGDVLTIKDKETGETRYNLWSYRNGGRKVLTDTLEKQKFSVSDVKRAADIMDEMAVMMENFAEKYASVLDWNNTEVLYDQNGKTYYSAMVKNGDYPINIDLSTICKKRIALQNVLNKLVKRNLINDVSLSPENIATINKILKDNGYETQCPACFVESKRYNVEKWANDFADKWNSVLEKAGFKATGSFDFSHGEKADHMDAMTMLTEDLSKADAMLASIGTPKRDENGNILYDKKGKAKMYRANSEQKIVKLLRDNPQLRKRFTAQDLIGTEGIRNIKTQYPEIYSLILTNWGVATPKIVQTTIPYNNEVAVYKNIAKKSKYIGGVRMFSFSDFTIDQVFDYVQVIADLYAQKAMMHTYTKEITFAKLFGTTGVKINLSFIPAIDKSVSKENAGLNAKGELIYSEWGVDPKEADALMSDSRYSPNLTPVMIGVSDNHIWKLLDTDSIRYIIPYHKSALNPVVAKMTEIEYYKDYSDYQTTRHTDGTGLTKGENNKFDFYKNLEKTKDARESAKAYLEWCDENGYIPKFEQFRDHKNYYKLLIDFNLYDAVTGEFVPQKPVAMNFPAEFSQIVGEELAKQKDLSDKLSVKEEQVFTDIVNAIRKEDDDNRFSLKSPVEETNKLIALHNVSSEKLLNAIKLGGLPNLSIAIVKDSMGFSQFGDISLLFNKSLIDPKNANVRVYGRDAWTATKPRIEYKVDNEKANAFDNKISHLSGSIFDGVFERSNVLSGRFYSGVSEENFEEITDLMKRKNEVKVAYIADKGLIVSPVYKEKVYGSVGNNFLKYLLDTLTPEEIIELSNKSMNNEISEDELQNIRDAYVEFNPLKGTAKKYSSSWSDSDVMNIIFYSEMYYEDLKKGNQGKKDIDAGKTLQNIDSIIAENEDDFSNWVETNLAGVVGKAGIRNSRETFTTSGKRRNFDQLYDPVTLENIVRSMNTKAKESNYKGIGQWSKDATALAVRGAKEYRSYTDIRNDKNRLTVNVDLIDEATKIADEHLNDVITLIKDRTGAKEYFIRDAIIESASTVQTESAIKRVFAEYDISLGSEQVKEVQKVLHEAAEIPTDYFEAKLYRATGFNEIAGAIFGKNLPSDIKRFFEENNIPYKEVDFEGDSSSENEKQKRANAVNELADELDVKFSLKSHIIGESGKDYGKGVYLDSNLLDGLTEAEQKKKVIERVKELGGQTFTAYDNNGTPIDVKIAKPLQKFKNAKGKNVKVLQDLSKKYSGNEIKRQAVILSDELIEAANFESTEKSKYPHGWLDNYGLNNWDTWTVYLQEKNNSVWSAKLKIANSENGDKYLYDIVQIKMVEGGMNFPATATTNKISYFPENVNDKSDIRNSLYEYSDSDAPPVRKNWQPSEADNNAYQNMVYKGRFVNRKIKPESIEKALKNIGLAAKDRRTYLNDVAELYEYILNDKDMNPDDLFDRAKAISDKITLGLTDNVSTVFDGLNLSLDEAKTVLKTAGTEKPIYLNSKELSDLSLDRLKELKKHYRHYFDIATSKEADVEYINLEQLQENYAQEGLLPFPQDEKLSADELFERVTDYIDAIRAGVQKDYLFGDGTVLNEDGKAYSNELAVNLIEGYFDTKQQDKTVSQLKKEISYLYSKIDKQGRRIELMSNYRLINEILDDAQQFKDWYKGKRDASHLKNDLLDQFIKQLSKLKYRSDIRKASARNLVAGLKGFYTEAVLNEYYQPEVAQMIEAIANSTETGDLTHNELVLVNNIVKAIKKLYTDYDTIVVNGKRETIKNIATEQYYVVNKAGKVWDKRYKNWWHNKMLSGLAENAGAAMVEPRIFYESMEGFAEDGLFKKMFNDLTDGETKMMKTNIELMRDVNEFIEKHKGYEKRLHEEIDVQGKKITINQAMELYLLMQREEAQASLTSTALNSGVFWRTEKDNKLMRVGAFDKTTLPKFKSDLLAKFTATDKEFMALAKEFFNVKSRNVKYETDIELLGFSNVTDSQNYIPIRRKGTQIAKAYSDVRALVNDVTSAYNFSFNKNAVMHSEKGMELTGLYELMNAHANKMAMYAGMTRPLQNFDKVLNRNISDDGVATLKDELVEMFTDKTLFEKYHSKFMQDVQNRGRQDYSKVADFTNKMRSKFATAKLGLNLRTIMGQPAGYPMILMYLSPESVAKGLTMKTDTEAMYKYSDFAMARDYEKGFVLGQTLTDKVGKFADKTTAGISWMDKKMMGCVWNACVAEAESKYKLKPKSEECYKKAAELFEMVTRRTQSNYTQTERSGFSRHQNEFVKAMNMFRSDADKQLSRLAECALKFSFAKKAGDTAMAKTAKKQAALTSASVVTSWVMFGILRASADWLMPKDEDDEKFLENVWENIKLSVLGVIPIVDDLKETFVDGYDMENFVYSMINDLAAGTAKWFANPTDKENWVNLGKTFMEFNGLPANNFVNTVKKLSNKVNGFEGSTAGAYKVLAMTTSVSKESNRSDFTTILANALMENDIESAKYIISDMKQHGHTSEQIANSLKTIFANKACEAYLEKDKAEMQKILSAISKVGISQAQLESKMISVMVSDIYKDRNIKKLGEKIKAYNDGSSKYSKEYLTSKIAELILTYKEHGYPEAVIRKALKKWL